MVEIKKNPCDEVFDLLATQSSPQLTIEALTASLQSIVSVSSESANKCSDTIMYDVPRNRKKMSNMSRSNFSLDNPNQNDDETVQFMTIR